MKKRRAVIYARVSKDKSGVIRSISEQVTEGKRVIASRPEWELGPVVAEDEAISASRYSAKDRPGYRKLLGILEEGDVLVVWAQTRTGRMLEDWLALRKLCETLGVWLCAGGQVLDLSRSSDRFTGGINALIAERDVDEIREGVQRALRANLESGKPQGFPPFGYQIIRDKRGRPTTREINGRTAYWEFDDYEAPLIREFANRLLDGESLRTLTNEFYARGVRGKRGGFMQSPSWRRLLLSPAIVGHREHKGVDVGPGAWPAIISEEVHYSLVALFSEPGRLKHRGSALKRLLPGVARCGKCGGPMKSSPSSFRDESGNRRYYYTCRRRQEGRVDGIHVTKFCDFADAVVNKFMRQTLASPEAVNVLNAYEQRIRSDNQEWRKAHEEANRKEAYLERYIDAASDPDGGITPQALARMEKKLRPEIELLRRRARLTHGSADLMADLLSAEDSVKRWEGLSLEQQREVLNRFLVITFLPTGRGKKATEKDIRIQWNDEFGL